MDACRLINRALLPVLVTGWISQPLMSRSQSFGNPSLIVSDTLSLRGAIQYALTHNQTVLFSLRQNFVSASARLRSVEAGYNPMVNASGSLFRFYNRTKLQAEESAGDYFTISYMQEIIPNLSLQQTFLTPLGGNLTLGAGLQTTITGLSRFRYLTTPQVSFSYQQPLSAAGVASGHADIISAKRSYLSSELAFVLGKNEFVLSVIEGYFLLWRSMRQVDQSERDLNSTKRVLDVAEIKLKSGSISEFEVLNLRVQNRLSEDNLLQARNNLETQQMSFYQLIGDTTDLWLPGRALRLAYDLPLDSMSIDCDSAVAIALNHRIEVKQAEVAVDQSLMSQEQTASSNSPTIRIQANYNFSSEYEPSFTNSIMILPNYGWSLQASVVIPLWDGGRTAANLEVADIDIAVQRENVVLLKEGITIDVKNRYRTLMLDLRRLSSLTLNLKAAEEALSIAELRFQSGQISSTEIDDIRNRFNMAENTLNQAKISCVLDRAGLAQAMGELGIWLESLKRFDRSKH